MIKVIYSGKDLEKIKKDILKISAFLYNLFLIKTPHIIVRIHHNRADFNKQLKTKTADWCIANASYNNEIDILSPSAMEKESSHSKNEFLPVLKHEFTHLFINRLVDEEALPRWLDEGLAQYMAGQHKSQKSFKNIEVNFCKKLSTPNSWYKRVDRSAYPTAALFVYFLIRKYSFKKIKELLYLLDKKYSYPVFKKIFFKVYKKDLSEMERLFVKEINE